jgi:hypothetical protein
MNFSTWELTPKHKNADPGCLAGIYDGSGTKPQINLTQSSFLE